MSQTDNNYSVAASIYEPRKEQRSVYTKLDPPIDCGLVFKRLPADIVRA